MYVPVDNGESPSFTDLPLLTSKNVEMLDVPLHMIDPAEFLARPVDDGEYMADLLESLRTVGQIDPCTAFRKGDRFEIIDGMHRFTGARLLGWQTLRLQVWKDSTMAREAIQLHTCQVHKEMTAWEQHLFYKNLCDRLGMTFEDVCVYTRRSEAYVSLRLCLGNLTPECQTAMQNNRITLTMAAQLLRIKEPLWQNYWLDQCLINGVGAKVLVGWVNKWLLERQPITAEQIAAAAAAPPPPPAPELYICGLCGKPSNGRTMMQVWVHIDEIGPLSAAIQTQDRVAKTSGGE